MGKMVNWVEHLYKRPQDRNANPQFTKEEVDTPCGYDLPKILQYMGLFLELRYHDSWFLKGLGTLSLDS